MGIQINGQTDTITAIDGSITVGTDLTVPGVLTYEDVTNIDAVGLSTFQNGIHVTGGSVGIGTDTPVQLLDVTGSGDKKIRIASTSSGVGSNSALLLKTATEGEFTIQTGNAVSGGLRIYDVTAGSERLRINSSGIVTKPYTPAFRVRSTTNSSAFTGGATASWDDVSLNNGSHFLTSGTGAYERFVAPVDGLYFISCMMLSQAGTRLFHEIRVNNVTVEGTRTESYTASAYQTNTTVATLELSASDYVTIFVTTNDGYGGSYSNFNGFLIG